MAAPMLDLDNIMPNGLSTLNNPIMLKGSFNNAQILVTRLQSVVYHSFVRYTWKRSLHSSALICAGQDWRIKHGFSRSGSEYGPLTDLPDWSFADGRPAPPWKGQSRRKEESKELASRIVMLSNEIDQGIKKWTEKQESLKEQQILTQKNQLKSKAIFKKSSKSS